MRMGMCALLLTGCVCGPGQLLCGSVCSDLQSDRANCGTCGHVCVGTCTRGVCDPTGTCRADADCSDGVGCNGTERCLFDDSGLTRCTPGSPYVCGDRNECTDDVCVEPGECTSTPNDLRCPDGICTSRGCETCSELPCRLRAPQCGCHDGEGCYADGTGAVGCAPAGTLTLGTACVGIADCLPGLICVSLTDTYSQCMSPCTDASECGRDCVFEGAFGTDPPIGVCSFGCDPVDDRGCGLGHRCGILVDGSDFTAASVCVPTGTVPDGGSCTTSETCRSGICVTYATGGRCEELCNLNYDCRSTENCVDFGTPVTYDGARLGYCQ